MEHLAQEEWVEELENDENAVILDVRTENEVRDGIIKNAIHIDIYKGQEFVNALQDLDKSKNYYVYCRSGNRSGQACAIMDQLGFANAYNLQGGILQWTGDLVDFE
jgi:rhodanese-related sulfurtransferase